MRMARIERAEMVRGCAGLWLLLDFAGQAKSLMVKGAWFRRVLDYCRADAGAVITDTGQLRGRELILDELPARSGADLKWIDSG